MDSAATPASAQVSAHISEGNRRELCGNPPRPCRSNNYPLEEARSLALQPIDDLLNDFRRRSRRQAFELAAVPGKYRPAQLMPPPSGRWDLRHEWPAKIYIGRDRQPQHCSDTALFVPNVELHFTIAKILKPSLFSYD